MRNTLEYPITHAEVVGAVEEAYRLSAAHHDGELGSMQPFVLARLLHLIRDRAVFSHAFEGEEHFDVGYRLT